MKNHVCNKSYLFPYELRRHKIRAHNIDQEIMDDSIGKVIKKNLVD